MGEKETTMAQYSLERKQAILNKLLSPELISIAQLARDETSPNKPYIIGVIKLNAKGKLCRPTIKPKN